MQSRSGNPLATLMLSLPLMAIPLMAVFGVPQFVPVVASSISEADRLPLKPRRMARIGESVSPQMALLADSSHSQNGLHDETLDDLFRPNEPQRSRQPLTRTAFAAASPKSNSQTSRQSTSESASNSVDSRLADLFGMAPPEVPAQPAIHREPSGSQNQSRELAQTAIKNRSDVPMHMTDDGLTWRQAVKQLNQLGIHDYRLEPGSQPGDFYFACDFGPVGNPQVTRRFEAEASEPLQAVQIVLRQINDWSAQH